MCSLTPLSKLNLVPIAPDGLDVTLAMLKPLIRYHKAVVLLYVLHMQSGPHFPGERRRISSNRPTNNQVCESHNTTGRDSLGNTCPVSTALISTFQMVL